MGTENVEYERLGNAKLSFPDVIAQSVGFMGPVFGAILLLVTVVGANNAGKGAGLATPLAIIVAAIGVGALGWLIAQFAKRIHAAGALYDYISAGFGERVGFVFGWIYLGGLLVLAIAIPLLIGGVTSDWLASHNIHIPYWVLDLVYVAILFCVLFFGVRISTRVQLALVFVSASVVTIFLIYLVFKSGSNSVKPFQPSSAHGVGNFFYGVLYAILLFVGFESAANLAEETSNPKRSIPRAVLWSVGIVTVYFVLASYAQAVGFHLDVKAWATSGAPLIVLALPSSQGGLGAEWLFNLMNVILILDLAAVGIGASVAFTRLLFSLGRDRRVPGVFARVSGRFGTPTVAIITVVALAVIEILWVRAAHGILPLNGQPEYLVSFFWMAQYGSLSLAVIYAALALASIRGLYGHVNNGGLVIAVVLSLAITGLAIFSAIYKVPTPFNTVTAWFLGWAAIGVIILIVLVSQRKFRLSAQAAGAITEGELAAGQVEAGVASPGAEVRPEF
ncbi:MAG TPA: APC family permease [Actinomycetota bacterium]